MNSINTSLRIRCAALIKRSALDHIISSLEKKGKAQKRAANFLASIESAGESDSLITPSIIKPGYLPEQPASHVPGESARHFLGASGRSYSAEISERKAIGSPFRTWASSCEDKRKERRERSRPWARNLAGRGGNGAQVDHSGERGLRCIPAPMSTNEQLGRQDQSYWSGLRLFSQGWLVCLRLCYGCYSCGQGDAGSKWM